MDQIPPDEFTPEDRETLAKLRAEKRIRAVMEPILEQRRCQQFGISYSEENPELHRAELLKIDLAQREIVAQHMRNWKWLGAAGRAAGAGSASIAAKVWNSLAGAVVLIVLGWLATRFGFKLPGVP